MMMAQVVRPLRTSLHPTFLRLLSPFIIITTTTTTTTTTIRSTSSKLHQKQEHHHHRCLTFAAHPHSNRKVGFRSQAIRTSAVPLLSDAEGNNSESDENKSRNEKKREARRAFQWGLEIANFSVPQIKLIVRAASLEPEVFDALMLVKKLGPDVREGKRRQFNYIGRLLRNVQPELMNALLQATLEGDNSKLQALCGTGPLVAEKDEEEFENEEEEVEEEEEDQEGGENYVGVAARWFEGLIDNNSDITKEVYSIYSVEFDRQELRKLVRRVHSNKEKQLTNKNDDGSDSDLVAAEKALIHFLRSIAKQLPTE